MRRAAHLLVFTLPLLLAGCFPLRTPYPAGWASLDHSTPNDCTSLSGRYSNPGTGGPRTHTLDYRPFLQGYFFSYSVENAAGDIVEFSFPEPGVFRVRVQRNAIVINERLYRKALGEYACDGDTLALTPGFQPEINEMFSGFKNSEIRFNKDLKGNLIALREDQYVGCCALMLPIGISENFWDKFPPATPGAAEKPR